MWYYVQNNERMGPVDDPTVTTLIQNGTIQRDSLVWREGMGDWQRADKTVLNAKFEDSTQAAPPAAPVLIGGTPYPPESLRTLWLWFVWCIGLGIPLCFMIIGIVPVIAGVVFSYVLLYRFWAIIQDGQARTTPGKAVGFCFIPFFNLYWLYVAFLGLAQDMNRYCEERNIDGPRVNEGLALAYFILALCSIIPYIGTMIAIAELVIFIILMKQFVDQGMQVIRAKQADGPAEAPLESN